MISSFLWTFYTDIDLEDTDSKIKVKEKEKTKQCDRERKILRNRQAGTDISKWRYRHSHAQPLPRDRHTISLRKMGGGSLNPQGETPPHPTPKAAHVAEEDLVVRRPCLWAPAYRDRPLDSAHHRGSRPTLHGLLGSRGLLALGLPLLPLAVTLHKGALHLGNDIRVSLGVLDALPNREQKG